MVSCPALPGALLLRVRHASDAVVRSRVSIAPCSAAGMICVDSVAAPVPRAELEGDMGDMQMGLQAR